MNDAPTKKSTLHAAILRSPHAHAEIVAIDAGACLARPDDVAVITGRETREFTDPLKLAADTPVEYRCLAVDQIRFVGEPAAILDAMPEMSASI